MTVKIDRWQQPVKLYCHGKRVCPDPASVVLDVLRAIRPEGRPGYCIWTAHSSAALPPTIDDAAFSFSPPQVCKEWPAPACCGRGFPACRQIVGFLPRKSIFCAATESPPEVDIIAAFSGTTDYGQRFVIYIPNRVRDGAPVDQATWIDAALRLLTDIAVGATARLPVTRAWRNPQTGQVVIRHQMWCTTFHAVMWRWQLCGVGPGKWRLPAVWRLWTPHNKTATPRDRRSAAAI
jgi:hypothetical protein